MGRDRLVGKLRAERRLGLADLTGARSLAQQSGAVFRRNFVADSALGALGLVSSPERTGDHLRLQHAADQLQMEAFLPEAATVDFVYTVLSRSAQLDDADPDPVCARHS